MPFGNANFGATSYRLENITISEEFDVPLSYPK